jgi:subtilisin family serine protease
MGRGVKLVFVLSFILIASISFVYAESDSVLGLVKDSYIVEYKEPSVLGLSWQITSEIEEKTQRRERLEQEIIDEAFPLDVPEHIALFFVRNNLESITSDFEDDLDKQKEKIRENHRRLKTHFSSQTDNKEIQGEFEKVFSGAVVKASEGVIEEIKNQRYVKKVHKNQIVSTTLQESVPSIKASEVWKLDEDGNNCSISGKECLTGKGVSIAIIDTGVDYLHPDLGGCFGSGCKVIGGWDIINNDSDPADDHGHGTHVAAIAAGNGVLKGVAPDANIIAYKVLNSGGYGTLAEVIGGVERAVDPNQDGNFSDRVDIMSISLGGFGNPDDPVSMAVDNAVGNGAVAVVAAGNNGPSLETIRSPGTARKAITIGAISKIDTIAFFSSRGPVVWEDEEGKRKAILKPDVIAPGVDICAAEWDNAWSDKRCLDDRHVALSGTSMATPHVSGVVALLLQKDPGMTPEKVKMILKNSSVSLGYSDQNSLGYGKIDALGAVEIGEIPIAILDTGGEFRGKIDIRGTAKGQGFLEYTLYSGEGVNPQTWKKIYTSTEQVQEGILFEDFDTTSLSEGENIIRLVVKSSDGQEGEDRNLFLINNIELISVGDTLNYISGTEEVRGKIYTPDIDAYSLDYRRGNGSGWNSICSDSGKPSGEVLCKINVGNFEEGVYYFRISVTSGGKTYYDEEEKVVVFKRMLEGWPLEFPGFNRGHVNLALDENGDQKIILPSYPTCTASQDTESFSESEIKTLSDFVSILGAERINEPEFSDKDFSFYSQTPEGVLYNKNDGASIQQLCSSGLSFYILDGDGKYRRLESALEGRSSYPFPWDDIPVVTEDNYLALNNDYSILTTFPGLIDLYGNYIYKWEDDVKGGSFVVSGDSLYSIDHTWKLFIQGFNREGDFLPGFPIDLQRNISKGFIAYRLPVVFEEEQEKVGVLYGYFSLSGGFMSDVNLFFDVYSSKGELINHKLLPIFNRDKTWLHLSNPVVGDFDKDGSYEVVFGLMNLDADLFLKDRYDIDAYPLTYYVLESTGEILSTPYSTKGFSPGRLALGSFDGENVDIIATLATTLATTTEGFKVVSFDYLGNVAFEVNSDEYNELAQGLTIGDINSDGSKEIIVNYRPRWYNEKPSGVKIFTSEGNLIEDIEIPTMGIADDYWGNDPILTDVNNNGKVDVIQQSLFMDSKGYATMRVYAYELGGDYDSESMDWPMFQHDPQHTGCYDCVSEISPCTDSDRGEDIYSKGTCILEEGTSFTDACLFVSGENRYMVEEYSCADLTLYPAPTCVKKTFRCPLGCSDGACEEIPEEPSGSICGNGILETGEICDPAATDEKNNPYGDECSTGCWVNQAPPYWRGCRGSGAHVCTDHPSVTDQYFKDNPTCIPNPTCNQQFSYCNGVVCPEPEGEIPEEPSGPVCGDGIKEGSELCDYNATDEINNPYGERCSPLCWVSKTGTWKGCLGSGVHVCSEKVDDEYFVDHPKCIKHTSCLGLYDFCDDVFCPEPEGIDVESTCPVHELEQRTCTHNGVDYNVRRKIGCNLEVSYGSRIEIFDLPMLSQRTLQNNVIIKNPSSCSNSTLNLIFSGGEEPVCGNGILETGELCDHAASDEVNNPYGDQCSAGCWVDGAPPYWSGCRGSGAHVCTDHPDITDSYFVDHPTCIPNPTCNRVFYGCNGIVCPAPISSTTGHVIRNVEVEENIFTRFFERIKSIF